MSNNSEATREITLREVVTAVRSFIKEALHWWWLFVLLFVVIGGYLIYKAVTTPPEYNATLTFMVNEDESGGISGVASILGQFGLGGRRGRYNLDKILELSKSRRIVQETVFQRTKLDGEEDYLANHILNVYGMVEKWVKDTPEFEGFRFSSDSIELFGELERMALLRIHRRLAGGEKRKGLLTNSFSEESSILTINARTLHQDLSLSIVNLLFESLSNFYVNQAIERQQTTYNILRDKVDSVATALSSAEVAYARLTDANQNVLLSENRVREGQLRREITKLNAIQIEALKNLELADFALKNATPFIQEIDRPIAPLQPEAPSVIKAGVIGAFVSFLLGSIWIIGHKVLVQFKQVQIIKNE